MIEMVILKGSSGLWLHLGALEPSTEVAPPLPPRLFFLLATVQSLAAVSLPFPLPSVCEFVIDNDDVKTE